VLFLLRFVADAAIRIASAYAAAAVRIARRDPATGTTNRVPSKKRSDPDPEKAEREHSKRKQERGIHESSIPRQPPFVKTRIWPPGHGIAASPLARNPGARASLERKIFAKPDELEASRRPLILRFPGGKRTP
jgi:hypothetical protein